ncbi:MAG TPA: hypothetical protein VFQ31_00830 [Methyloceanibacter sp.]|nr:hypothetical protein [Methyloceanibacter sp.]
MALFEHERLAAGVERCGIAFEYRCRSGIVVDGKSVLALGEDGARDQPHEIDRIGHAGDFIEIVDTPDQPAFGVPPRAEILDMQIADREHAGGLGKIRHSLLPQRRPAIEGPAQKDEDRVPHKLVFQLDVSLDNIEALAEPALIGLRGGGDRNCSLASHRCACR